MFLHNVCSEFQNQKHFIDAPRGKLLALQLLPFKNLRKMQKKKLHLSKYNRNTMKYIRNVHFTRKNYIHMVK